MRQPTTHHSHPGIPPQEPPRTVMTLRVSRDSGRTWTDKTQVSSAGRPAAIANASIWPPRRWPPCSCPRCLPDDHRPEE